MKAVELEEYRIVRLDGIKTPWKINLRGDVQTLDDGTVFVKLNTKCSSLWGLLAADNTNVVRGASLATSSGLKELIELRNQAQQQLFEESTRDASCQLFDAPKKRPRALNTRDQMKELRGAPQSMSVTLAFDGESRAVQVLRPAHPNDSVFVEYSRETLITVLHFLRRSDFTESKRCRHTDLPRGIQRRKQGFLVSFTKADGSPSTKSFKELDDALAHHANPEELESDVDNPQSEQEDIVDEAEAEIKQ